MLTQIVYLPVFEKGQTLSIPAPFQNIRYCGTFFTEMSARNVLMRKKLSWLCIVGSIIVLCIFFFIWQNRMIRMADIIDFDMITKVEIWLHDDCVTLTENGDIKEFTAILDSMKLKKKLRTESDGFVFSIVLYHENNTKNYLTLLKDIMQPPGCRR